MAHRVRANYEGDGGAFYHNSTLLSEGDIIRNGGNGLLAFDASRVSAIYGRSNTITPLSISIKFAIKY